MEGDDHNDSEACKMSHNSIILLANKSTVVQLFKKLLITPMLNDVRFISNDQFKLRVKANVITKL